MRKGRSSVKVVDVGPTLDRIDAPEVAAALGATRVVQWSEIGAAQRAGGAQVLVRVVLGDDPPRFILFQTAPERIDTMWTLWDVATETQWYLYGEGWEGAQRKAEIRIEKILGGKP